MVPYLGDTGKACKYGKKAYKTGEKLTNKLANKQFRDVARELGMNKTKQKEFSKYLHQRKKWDGMGGADNYSYDELQELGKEFLNK